MKTHLNLTTAAVALLLFATPLVLAITARAADRQITVNPKNFPTFTVNNDSEPAADVATTAPDAPPAKVTPKAFRVDDKPVLTEDASSEDAKPPVKFPRKKEDSFRFRVEDRSQQAVAEPTQDDDEDVAPPPAARPANLLNETVKLVKKPAAIQPADEATPDAANTDDSDHSAEISADSNEEPVSDTADEPAAESVAPSKHRMYYYASKQKSYEQSHADDETVDTGYGDNQQLSAPTYYDYSGASCNHSYNGY
jgi:hypothetical protein